MLERIGEANVTIHLDAYHMNIEEKGIGRGVPGTGTVDWPEVFRALAETRFSGDLVMESSVTLPPEIAVALSVSRPVARDRHEVPEKGVPYLKDLARPRPDRISPGCRGPAPRRRSPR